MQTRLLVSTKSLSHRISRLQVGAQLSFEHNPLAWWTVYCGRPIKWKTSASLRQYFDEGRIFCSVFVRWTKSWIQFSTRSPAKLSFTVPSENKTIWDILSHRNWEYNKEKIMLSIRPWGNERIALLVEMALLSVLFMFMWGKKSRRSGLRQKNLGVYRQPHNLCWH